jgi:hypothetical protein
VTITASQNLFLAVPGGGDDVFANVPTVFGSIDFYDVNYTDVFVSSNGYVTFGTGTADFADGSNQAMTEATYDTGPPRVAAIYADFLPGVAIGAGNVVWQFVENLTGWKVTWLLMDHYGPTGALAGGLCLTPGACNTFHLQYYYLDGRFEFDYSTPEQFFAPPNFPGALNSAWGISGITPGGDPLNIDPVTGLPVPLDPTTPLVPNYGDGSTGTPTSGDLVFYGGSGVVGTGPMSSFRTDLLTSIVPAVSGTGVIVTVQPTIFGGLGSGQANTYVVY